jgi:2-polyprenyl-6-methoxyphenol hydroxylase-like FAD-dependent oxidoreductase
MDFDAAIIGGGLAGSSLANTLARNGARVLIVEHEPQFRDRVRGEGMLPWGVGEALRLGIHQPLLDKCAAQEARWWTEPDGNRDLIETTPDGLGCLDFYHPDMQQCLLDLAVASGAELWRPAEAISVVQGDPPKVRVQANDGEREVSARLVVGADGRNSRVRSRAGFTEQRDPICLTCIGVLFRDLALPEDAVQFVLNPAVQQLSIIFPVGQKRFRAYIGLRHDAGISLHGRNDEVRFVEQSVAIGAPAEWFAPGVATGPLASFNAPDVWAEHPSRDGIV